MSARFPEELPQDPSAPLPAAGEAAELLALAEELRQAHPDPALSADFPDRVLAGLARASGLRALLRRSRVAQAAAAVFVLSISVAPVLALAQILPWLRETKLVIQVEQLLLPPRVDPRETGAPALPPLTDPSIADSAYVESVTRQNRLARAAVSWAAAGTAAPRARGPQPAAWDAATADDLWQEFLRRCAQGGGAALPAGLVARIELLSLVGGAEDEALLAPWTWVLRGSAVPGAEADRTRAWPDAPWLAAE